MIFALLPNYQEVIISVTQYIALKKKDIFVFCLCSLDALQFHAKILPSHFWQTKHKSGKSLWSTSGGPKKKETLNHNHAATADEKKTVDESPLSKTWLKLYLSLPYAYPASKILQMITVHLDLEQDRERQDCRLRKLLQLLRRLTGLAMMAADDTYTGVEVVAELSGATTPTNGFQARARSHSSRPPVKGGGAGGSAAAYRAPTPPPLTMIGLGRKLEAWILMEGWWQKAPNSNGKSS